MKKSRKRGGENQKLIIFNILSAVFLNTPNNKAGIYLFLAILPLFIKTTLRAADAGTE
jgi:hypothetical protein